MNRFGTLCLLLPLVSCSRAPSEGPRRTAVVDQTDGTSNAPGGTTRPGPRKTAVVDQTDGARILEITDTSISPNPKNRVVCFGEVTKDLDIYSLSYYIETKCAISLPDPTEAIREFMRLGNVYETVVVESLEEIPGYAERPLDSDLAGIKVGTQVTKNAEEEKEIVVYTYTRINGLLNRYKFWVKGKHFRCQSCTLMGRDIGDAHRLE